MLASSTRQFSLSLISVGVHSRDAKRVLAHPAKTAINVATDMPKKSRPRDDDRATLNIYTTTIRATENLLSLFMRAA